MLEDYEDGIIEGVVFYDVDRLARQPRDLEDLIDLVEYYKRPVETVTGKMDLRTSNGRAMARILVAMANKSSEDSSRRIARARLQEAQEGKNRTFRINRRFGYNRDGDIIEAEARVIREGAKRILAGQSWSSLVNFFTESGAKPVKAREWSYTTIRQIYFTPSIAGIAMYNGKMRKGCEEAPKSRFADPEAAALKDASGNYLMGTWKPILEVAEWKALMAEWQRRRAGQTFTARGTRKYLLSGLLRCGCIRPDGSLCNRPLAGTRVYLRTKPPVAAYKCPGKNQGGCGGVQRRAAPLDKLIEDLLFTHIEANAPADSHLTPAPDPDDPDVKELADVQRRLYNMRAGYARGTVSDESMFNIVPELEARERALKSEVAKKTKVRIGRITRGKSLTEVREEWDEATDVGVRRAILSRYLKAIIVRKSTKFGPGALDYSAIEPVWREDNDTQPDEYLP